MTSRARGGVLGLALRCGRLLRWRRLGAGCLWSIRELKEQAKRVERGWFPKNPKRK